MGYFTADKKTSTVKIIIPNTLEYVVEIISRRLILNVDYTHF